MTITEHRQCSDPSQAWTVLTAKVPSKVFSNESKRTSITIPETVLTAQTASSGESPGPYSRGEQGAITLAFSQSIPVPMYLTRLPTPPHGYILATYQPRPSRESRPLPATPRYSSQSSPVREKRHNSRPSDTSYSLPPKYSPHEPGQGFDDDISEHLEQQSRTTPLPLYNSGYQGPQEEGESVYLSSLSSSNAESTTHSPVASTPANDKSKANAPDERSPRHSNATHLATPTSLEVGPSTPINTPDHFFPPSTTTVLGPSGDTDNEQAKGPPTMTEVYAPGQSSHPKPKGRGSNAPKLRVANPTPNAIASGSTNVPPLSDSSMPMLPAQAAQRTPPTSSGHLHSDEVQSSSSSQPTTALSNPQFQPQDTSPTTSPTTGTPKPFIYPTGRSQATPSVSSDNTEHSRFNRVLRLLKNWKKKDLKKLDKGKQRQEEGESDIQTTPVRSGSPPLSNPSSGYLAETTDLGAEVLDESHIRRASNSNSGEMGPDVVEEHVEGGPSKSRIGSYPLDPFDTVLLDHDRRTGELLRRLNLTESPTFYDYGTLPPRNVLDLGCGQGHWVVQAAIKWGGYGTMVTGYDKVDISKASLPLAIEHGVINHIEFVRGNFLKQQLPFKDSTFDLVRMSCLTLCVPAGAWPLVFQEVCRVLAPGGRLEVIEDSIIFPPPPLVAAPLDLESLFEQMLLWTFGISLHPETFISQLMNDIFGYGELVKDMHLTLAHSPRENEAADAGEGLSSVGLLLLPSTFFPMEQGEIDMHTSKHMRSLLSCKHFLIEYVTETASNEEVSDEMVQEALPEYESSMHQRLDPLPPDTNGRASDSQISIDSTGLIRTFRVFQAIKMERIVFTSPT